MSDGDPGIGPESDLGAIPKRSHISFIHSLIHSFTHSFISSVQFNSPPSFVPLISFIHSSVQFSSVHSFVHLIPFFHSCMHAFFRISIVIYVYIYVYIHISLPLHMYIHVNTRLCVYNSIEDQRMAFHRVSMKVVWRYCRSKHNSVAVWFFHAGYIRIYTGLNNSWTGFWCTLRCFIHRYMSCQGMLLITIFCAKLWRL